MFTASASASFDQQTKRKSKEALTASDNYYDDMGDRTFSVRLNQSAFENPPNLDYVRQKAKGLSKFCRAVRCSQILVKHV